MKFFFLICFFWGAEWNFAFKMSLCYRILLWISLQSKALNLKFDYERLLGQDQLFPSS